MPGKSHPNVKKLLRVLVAGGVALAGVDGARAEDPSAASTQKPDKATDKDQQAKDAQKAKADREAKEGQKKKAEEDKKAAQSEGDGVKGW